ncbi:hypothetical protein ACFW1M_37745 [Streptomyces inhibens]|uniref:hypothetical protein n=1 Tax=Streptomyces inhibens TaxID=2293571 RepID=UPI003697FE7B
MAFNQAARALRDEGITIDITADPLRPGSRIARTATTSLGPAPAAVSPPRPG